ncbi:hypothetical protein BVY04_04845 [bacterium M21]|nr:hypothetical protein BVY04_04845 [bacterium M21]
MKAEGERPEYRKMNDDEKLADSFLRETMGEDVVFEPDGNVPPDFLVDGELAVEVRRLNHNYTNSGKTEGLENTTEALSRIVTEVSSSFRSEEKQDCYYLQLRYHRPVKFRKKIKQELKRQLEDFLDNPIWPKTIKLSANLSVVVMGKAGSRGQDAFHLGMWSDYDAGGRDDVVYLANINHAINEKSSKISRAPEEYTRWWLILVDRIGLYQVMDDIDLDDIAKDKTWERVIVIHPHTAKAILIRDSKHNGFNRKYPTT